MLNEIKTHYRTCNICEALCGIEIKHDKIGVSSGDFVLVKSRVGEIKVEAKVTDEIMPSVVSLPQGFGAGKKSRMSVAVAQNSASINDLTDDLRVDTLTGNAALNGVCVGISKVDDNKRW